MVSQSRPVKIKLTYHEEMGHTARGCKQERAEYERVEVRCVNCNEPGHRARDCTEKRRDKFACRNCGYVFFLLFPELYTECEQGVRPQSLGVP